VPYVCELSRVVRDRFREDARVRNMDHPSGALVRAHPIPDLQKGELKESDIDYVPEVDAYPNSIPS